ncbi:murein L,D-transpeptidase catalytic domain family protein [Alistipes sp. OttesenSCG-928-B03]|nr:murein L,D-transpeptidase catalytic domain family protein [Alistipes sp. OttesenSCG-928-B03]
MQRFLLLLLLIIVPLGNAPAGGANPVNSESHDPCRQLYHELKLADVVQFDIFRKACAGYEKIEKRRGNILTLVDFTKPSTDERMYVIDMARRKLLFTSHVSHGRNSGENYATSFSNENGSHKSSLGFYLTGDTYQGKNGYSLLLHGLEKGINDKARERAVVIHAAEYANPSVIKGSGRLGRSFGCPALPQAVNDAIINTIKGGTVLFIYADDANYLSQSKYISRGAIG